MNAVPSIPDVSPESPWLGLRSFTENASPYFFGREAELSDLCDRVLHKPLTILFGQSGWGKSSLLQAGLVPRLRSSRFLPVLVRLMHEKDAGTLEAQVIRSLSRAMAEAGCERVSQTIDTALQQPSPPGLWLLFHDPVYGLADEDPQVPVPVFIFDQFEEIFTLGTRPERAQESLQFKEALASLIENRPTAAARQMIEADDDLADSVNYQARKNRVLLALRYDFLHLLERWRKQIPAVMENRMELRLLSGTQAYDAIVRPGQMRLGHTPIIPENVGRAIVRFVAGVGKEVPLPEIDAVPPLLSLVCAELNAQRLILGSPQISQSHFEGGSSGILDSFYERSFDPATYGAQLEQVPYAAEALRTLRVLVEDRLLSADGFRESIAFDTMLWELSDQADKETSKKILSLLVERRLLSVDERGGVQRLELTHDVLTRIAKGSRDARVEKEALERAKLDQEKAEAETLKVLAQKNRLRRFAIAAAAAAILAVVAAAFGWIGMNRARDAAVEAKRQETEAKRQETEAKRQRAEADAGFKAARDATDKMVARIAGEDYAYIPGMQPLREEMSAQAISLYQYLLTRRPADQSIQIALLKAEAARATILEQIGTLDEARTAFEALVPKLRKAQESIQSNELEECVFDMLVKYDRFQMDNGFGWDKSLLEQAIQIAEELSLSSESKVGNAGKTGLVRAYNSLGNRESETKEKIRCFFKAREIGLPLLSAPEIAPSVYDRMFAATHNLGRQHQYSASLEEQTKGLELMREAESLQQKALAAQPDSPRLLSNAALGLLQRAELQVKLGKGDEARQTYEQSIIRYRMTVAANPRVTQYRSALAIGLKDYGGFLSQMREYDRAKEVYQEGASLLEELIARRDSRPTVGTYLMQIVHRLSEFEESGKGTGGTANDNAKQGADPAAAAATRDRGIEIGRKLVSTFPDHVELRYEFGRLLAAHARSAPLKENLARKISLFEEAASGMRSVANSSPQMILGYHAAQYLSWITELDDSLRERAEKEQPQEPATTVGAMIRVPNLDSGLEWQRFCKSYDEIQGLILLANKRSLFYLADKQPQKAVDLLVGFVTLYKSTYEEKPHYYYLRDAYGVLHRNLARAYEQLGRKKEEIQAWQQWLKILVIPNFGPRESDLLDANLPVTEENLKKLRGVVERLPKTKLFIVPCDVIGVKIPIQFYIHGGVPAKGADPIEDQARWIKEERGITVPEDVRDSLRKLSDIAHENNVDFVDLCTYALNYPDSKTPKKEQAAAPAAPKREQAAAPEKVSDKPSPPSQSSLSKALDEVAAARKEFATSGTDAHKIALARALGNAAFDALFEKRFADAETWSREALALEATLALGFQPASRAGLVFIQANLAHAMLLQGKFYEALAVYRTHWEKPMQGRTFKEAVMEDFAMFERSGVTHPDLPRLRKALAITKNTPFRPALK